jgi:hypothetical protein
MTCVVKVLDLHVLARRHVAGPCQRFRAITSQQRQPSEQIQAYAFGYVLLESRSERTD